MISPETLDLSALPSLPLKELKQLPCVSCVYFAIHEGVARYVGGTVNLRNRWASHHCHKHLDVDRTVIAWLEVEDLEVTTPVIDPVNGYNTGFTATPAIAFGNSLCFNHGMPSRRG